MRAIRFFRNLAAPAPSSNDKAETSHAPARAEQRARSSAFSLLGLKSRGAKAGTEAPGLPSMPPRSSVKLPPLRADALIRLMHDERKTGLTAEYIARDERSRTPKGVKFAKKVLVQDGAGALTRTATKRWSTHTVLERAGALTRSNSERRDAARIVAESLAVLAENDRTGTLRGSIEQGRIPHDALEGVNFEEIDEADVIHEFHEMHRVRNQRLLRGIAENLKKLGARSPEEATELLDIVMRDPNARFDVPHSDDDGDDSDEIAEERSDPAAEIRTAYAALPERLRGEDVAEMFESLGQLHPRAVMNAKGQAYLDTIDERLAQLNASGSRSSE